MTLTNLFKYGTVVDINDEFDGDRIKVYVKGLDPQNFTLNDIPFAFPLLPKTLHTKPKVGEKVMIFTQTSNPTDDRFWLGPIISQPNKMSYDPLLGDSFLTSNIMEPGVAPSTNPENVGVDMDNDDVGLNGRGSTDLILKPDEIRIRAGKSLDFRELNKENPSYIQLKYDKNNKNSSINIISDNINLLSHKSADKFNLVDPIDLINNEEYNKILEKAHLLPYGDVLIDFIKLLLNAFTTHVHSYAGLPPDLTQIELKRLIEFELDKILSKNVRIN